MASRQLIQLPGTARRPAIRAATRAFVGRVAGSEAIMIIFLSLVTTR
jgi:hypothetical protein